MRCHPTKRIAAIGLVFEGTVEFTYYHYLPDNLMLPKRYFTPSLHKARGFAQFIVFANLLGLFRMSFISKTNCLTDLKVGSTIEAID